MKEMWSILNASYLIPLCLLFPPRILALGLLMQKLGFTRGEELLQAHLPGRESWSEAFPKADKGEVEAAVEFLNSHSFE